MLAGVGPATSSAGLPTFEFEATAPAVRSQPISQTVRGAADPTEATASAAPASPAVSVLLAVLLLVIGVLGFVLWTFSAGNDEHAEQAGLQAPAENPERPVSGPATLSLLLSSDPPGAMLTLDGEYLGNTAVTTVVQAIKRDYMLSAVLQGHHPGSMVCRIGVEAIQQGSFRCTVPLQTLATGAARVPSAAVDNAGRPSRGQRSGVKRSVPVGKKQENAGEGVPEDPDSHQDKPKIHKIE